MSLKQRIQDDIKQAMRAREAERLGAIRLLHAAVRQQEIDTRVDLNDAQIASVVGKLVKQRRDSISQYRAAARDDLADHEQFELDILLQYLPKQADEAEIQSVIAQAVAASAGGPGAMGAVMAHVRKALDGRADMATISARVKAALVPRS